MPNELDLAHKLTDKELVKLERRIAKIYKEARDDLDKTVRDYFESLEKRDAEMKKLIGSVQNGKEWTEDDYKQWRLNQIARGKKYEALRDLIAERYTKANEVAVAYVNDFTPNIYSLNRNYTAYEIENMGVDVSFTLFNEDAVRRLALEYPELVPNYPSAAKLNIAKDLAYGKKQINTAIVSAILQGKSIPSIADDLQSRIPGMSRVSAIRIARTEITNAQNAGRMDSMRAGANMGIRTYKKWTAIKDNRTRHAHGYADSQIVEYDNPFIVGGEEIMFPADPSASGWNRYNCRCTMKTVEKPGIEAEPRMIRVKNHETGRYELIKDMSYPEWVEMKKQENPESWGIYVKMGKNMSGDKKQYLKYKDILGNKSPQLFREFQDIKYNHPTEWAELKKAVRKAR